MWNYGGMAFGRGNPKEHEETPFQYYSLHHDYYMKSIRD
jgi:hypothetical protein